MEISGATLRRVPAVSGAGFRREAGGPSFYGVSIAAGRRRFGVKMLTWRRRVSVAGGGGDFSDEGHLRYYATPVRCGGGRRKEEKRRARLVESLSRDLSAFYSVCFGVEAGQGVVGDVKAKMISEAAEVLLAQLKQLRASEKDRERKRKEEKKEMKRKRKEEKAAMKAARLKDPVDLDTSSSSSSESSDSDCETVVKLSSLRTAPLPEPRLTCLEVPEESPKCNEDPLTLELRTEERMEKNSTLLKPEQECSSSSSSRSDISCKYSEMVVEKSQDRIEVCMGGKCKKSGALELLEELERKVGIEGAVVGCRCMGKCRDGPNVRVSDHCVASAKSSTNPLFIGVGLEDVSTIVAKFFGEEKDVGLVAA